MLNRATAGVSWDDLTAMPRTLEMGWNATGVVHTTMHITSDEIITVESMPGHFVDQIIDSVHELGAQQHIKRPGGKLIGQIPITLWRQWRKEWQAGPKQWGVPWRKHFQTCFLNSDHNKFRVRT